MFRISGLVVSTTFFLIVSAPVHAAADFVAGVAPDRRPEGAPRISAVVHPRAWYEKALTGIGRPYPVSLFFLDAQGDWYSPFTVPGMTGRYDLRGWHRKDAP